MWNQIVSSKRHITSALKPPLNCLQILSWQELVLLPLIYVLFTKVTVPHLMGDSLFYVDSILLFDSTGNHQVWDSQYGVYSFVEFGHLLWRPLGWSVYHLLDRLSIMPEDGNPKMKVMFALVSVSWVCGLVSLLLIYSIVIQICNKPWPAYFLSITFIASNSILNYVQTGSSYIAGLASLLIAIYLLLRFNSIFASVCSGLFLAISICFWVPYVLAVPATCFVPYLKDGVNRKQLKQSVYLLISLSVCVVFAYSVAVVVLGLRSFEEIVAWVASASHGLIQSNQMARIFFGIPRSFLFLDDGFIFKRYLLHDEFNPVYFTDILRLSLWKIILFYFVVMALLTRFAKIDGGRKYLTLIFVNSLPVLGFAFFFQASDMERYLPLYPSIFLALAYLVHIKALSRNFAILMVSLMGIIIINNLIGMGVITPRRERSGFKNRRRVARA